jgi:hypothetical protein
MARFPREAGRMAWRTAGTARIEVAVTWYNYTTYELHVSTTSPPDSPFSSRQFAPQYIHSAIHLRGLA